MGGVLSLTASPRWVVCPSFSISKGALMSRIVSTSSSFVYSGLRRLRLVVLTTVLVAAEDCVLRRARGSMPPRDDNELSL